jgi:hypothetical protein
MEFIFEQFQGPVSFYVYLNPDYTALKKEYTVNVEFKKEYQGGEGCLHEINKIPFSGSIYFRYLTSDSKKELRINNQFLRRGDRGYGKDDLTSNMYNKIRSWAEKTTLEIFETPDIEQKLQRDALENKVKTQKTIVEDLEQKLKIAQKTLYNLSLEL